MENNDLLEMVRSKAQGWLTKSYDAETRAQVQALLDNEDPTELIECFYKDLEFGTGGLRGIMGVGSNRMNIYTVGAATQGLSNYLKKEFADLEQIKVVIGHDCRNNSRKFAEISADIFSANGIKVYLFEDLRPTPEMSFAIRKLGCQSGIILTASHNPKEYNGYKAYWDDGAQMIAPHDKNTIAEVNKIRNTSEIKFKGNKELIEIIGQAIDDEYIKELTTISLSPEAISRHKDMKIVYTPIHGTGVKLVPAALKAYGFTNIIHVPELGKTLRNHHLIQHQIIRNQRDIFLHRRRNPLNELLIAHKRHRQQIRPGILCRYFKHTFAIRHSSAHKRRIRHGQ